MSRGRQPSLLRRLALALCRLGSHYDEPVAVRLEPVTSRLRPYVLLRCTRCGRDRSLVGAEAQAWIARSFIA